MSFKNVQPGDKVVRLLAGKIEQELTVTEVTDTRIIVAGGWQFDREYGYEIDEEIGWGVPNENGQIMTGSYLKKVVIDVQKGRQS